MHIKNLSHFPQTKVLVEAPCIIRLSDYQTISYLIVSDLVSDYKTISYLIVSDYDKTISYLI